MGGGGIGKGIFNGGGGDGDGGDDDDYFNEFGAWRLLRGWKGCLAAGRGRGRSSGSRPRRRSVRLPPSRPRSPAHRFAASCAARATRSPGAAGRSRGPSFARPRARPPGDGEDGDGDSNAFFRKVFKELYDAKAIQAVLQEWFKTMGDMPAILRQAAQMGLFSSAALVRFLSMDVRPSVTRLVTRSLPPAVRGCMRGPPPCCCRRLELAAAGPRPPGSAWTSLRPASPRPPGSRRRHCRPSRRAPAGVSRGGGPPDGRPRLHAEAGAGADDHAGRGRGVRGQGPRRPLLAGAGPGGRQPAVPVRG